MIQWQPMDTLTEKEEHGSIRVSLKGREVAFSWGTSGLWIEISLRYFGPQATLQLKKQCEGWQRIL